MSRHLRLAVALVVVQFVFAVSAHAQVATNVVDLGKPTPDAWAVRAVAINNSGQVATQVGAPIGRPAYIWSKANGWRSIGVSGGRNREICEPACGKSLGDGGSNCPDGDTRSGV